MKATVAVSGLVSLGVVVALVSWSACGGRQSVRTYPVSQYVEVYLSLDDVPEPFQVLGSRRLEAPPGMSARKLVAQMVSRAKEKGADAIVIDDLGLRPADSSEPRYSFADQGRRNDYYATRDGRLFVYDFLTHTYREAHVESIREDRTMRTRLVSFGRFARR